MTWKTDIEIAQETPLKPIGEIASAAGLPKKYIEKYGEEKAKVSMLALKDRTDQKDGKLILVTAMTPTPAGEGKTTTTVGLGDALQRIGKKTMIALREPSLGPVFGMKGGAAGGGYAQLAPMEDINLHFTGDLHAIGAANNLLAALIDNHIYQGNALSIDPRKVMWRRVMDMNDRQLRTLVSGLGGALNGMPREDGFDITVASEVMAILCLSESMEELKERIRNILIGYTFDNQPVTAGQLGAEGAMAVLLKDAMKPNLVQTLEHTPALVHGGPFANIAHGCNSVMATKTALKYADYVVTEAGFGADLGAEKFLDIKCRKADLKPDAVVMVATLRALKMHGGVFKKNLNQEDAEAVQKGFPNLKKHIENIENVYHLPVVVALNSFPTDTEKEREALKSCCEQAGIRFTISDVWAKGGEGGIDTAEAVVALCEQENDFQYAYNLSDTIEEKMEKIVTRVYGGASVEWTGEVRKKIARITALGYGNLPICVAKTQYSFSDNPTKIGRPEGFEVTVRDLSLSAGAGFIVLLTGEILRMPGLPKAPAAEMIDIDESGKISGLF